MLASLIVLFATTSMMSCARRLKYIPGLGVALHNMTGLLHTPANLLHPQMQVAAPFDHETREGETRPMQGWKAKISDNGVSHQMFPPTVIHTVDTRQLLYNWANSFVDPFEDKAGTVASTYLSLLVKDDGLLPLRKTPKYRDDEQAMVLHSMCEFVMKTTLIYEKVGKLRKIRPHLDEPTVIAQLSRRDRMRLTSLLFCESVEIVGLIPNTFEIPFLESGPPAVDASVLALGVLSRGQIEDDSSDSLHKKMLELHVLSRVWSDRPKKLFDVFAIEGLADSPGLPAQSARILLSKIQRYAIEEQRLVVVSKRAYISIDGTDLTEYYVHLGFEKVMMDDGLFELVYTGTHSVSAEDVFVENQQVMMRMDLWTGVI